MKKLIPVLAILGSAAAIIAYKMKKDEQKRIIDLDQGLLHDENLDESAEEVEEGPISDPQSCCVDDVADTAKEVVEGVKDTTKTIQDKVEEVKEDLQDFDIDFPALLQEEVQNLKKNATDIMETLSVEGDVHEHERPVQHEVVFSSSEDADHFKNEVINKGFVITKGKKDYELFILHITPLDDTKLIHNILFIANEAKRNHGVYKGWTSKVIY